MKAIETAQSIADELMHFNVYTTCLVVCLGNKTCRIPQKGKILLRDLEQSNDLMTTISNLRDGVQWKLITPTITDPEMEKAREKCYRG